MNYEELIKIKADLLCKGLNPTDEAIGIKKYQNPFNDPKTGNEGIFIALDNGMHKVNVLVSISHEFSKTSEYKIKKNSNRTYILLKKDKILNCNVFILDTPNWYKTHTTIGTPMADCFLHEGEHFLHQSYSGCEFHSSTLNQGCKFCSAKFPRKIASPDDVAETVITAFKENKNYQVILGGGIVLDEQKYFEYFLHCIQKIRIKNQQIPIWVEMIPPTKPLIEELINAGATSFGFNIEIWDDETRKEICPSKFELSTKTEYLDRMIFALAKLGKDKIGSALIAGIESKEETMKGIDTLTKIGIHPCILPFKPWNDAALKNKEYCTPNLFYELSIYSALKASENGLILESNQGCLLCDFCTLVHDFFKWNNFKI